MLIYVSGIGTLSIIYDYWCIWWCTYLLILSNFFHRLLFKLSVCGTGELLVMGEMLSVIRRNVIDLPTNLSLRYLWCGGFMIRRFLIVQVVSGVILSLLYVADSALRFGCVLSLTSEGLFI